MFTHVVLAYFRGHKSGERECLLKDYNPHDFARQQREDPLTYMTSSLQVRVGDIS